jgi:hypothetical protein
LETFLIEAIAKFTKFTGITIVFTVTLAPTYPQLQRT